MKRSDMYELMVKTMLDDLPDLNNINSLDITVCMDTVLNAIEEAGMLPPAVNPYKMNFELEDFEWEPEDEKK
jgi:hypothetical protein